MSALESALLGALLDTGNPALVDPASLIDIAGLRPEDLSDVRVRGAWQLAERMAQSRRPLSALTLFAEGKKRKLVGNDSLGWLQGLEASNTLDRAKFAEVATTVRTQSRRSQLAQLLRTQAAELERGGDLAASADLVEAACRDVGGLGHTHDLGSDDVKELADEWERRLTEGSTTFVPSGLRAVDELIGGWAPNLNIVAGLPSVGKSALLGTAIEQQLLAGRKVGLFGLEDGTRWLAKRIIARDAGVPVRDVGWKLLTAEQQERYVVAGQRLTTLLGGLVTYRRDTIDAGELCRRIAHWVTALGVQCIYVDHGGEVEHQHRNQSDDYRLAVSETYRRLRNLAVRYQIPVVVLAHTTRASDRPAAWGEEAPPRATDIAESAYIERRARVILGLWTKGGEDDSMRVTVLKQTEGKRGDTVRLDRLTNCALLDPASGTAINLQAERAAENKKRRQAREADSLAKKQATAAAKAAERAAREAAKKPKQTALSVVEETPDD